jgi:hypothetical protein
MHLCSAKVPPGTYGLSVGTIAGRQRSGDPPYLRRGLLCEVFRFPIQIFAVPCLRNAYCVLDDCIVPLHSAVKVHLSAYGSYGTDATRSDSGALTNSFYDPTSNFVFPLFPVTTPVRHQNGAAPLSLPARHYFW